MEYEHRFIGFEGSIDLEAEDLMVSFMQGARLLVMDVDQLIESHLPGSGWELVSHDVAVVGSKTLITLILSAFAPIR